MSGRPRPPAVAPPPHLRKRQIPRPPPPRKRAAPAPPPSPLPIGARPLHLTRPELQRQGYRDRSAPRPTAKRYTVFGSGTHSAHCGDVLTKRMKCERHSSAEQPARCGDVNKKTADCHGVVVVVVLNSLLCLVMSTANTSNVNSPAYF